VSYKDPKKALREGTACESWPLLRNEFYAGWVVLGDAQVRGNHEALITQELFDRVHTTVNASANFPIRRWQFAMLFRVIAIAGMGVPGDCFR
jgi:hypothetical protein